MAGPVAPRDTDDDGRDDDGGDGGTAGREPLEEIPYTEEDEADVAAVFDRLGAEWAREREAGIDHDDEEILDDE